MPAFTASAPGKIILFGEHSVVYGQPAIAVPLGQVRARAYVTANLPGNVPARETPSAAGKVYSTVTIEAPDIGLISNLAELPADHPLSRAILSVFETLHVVLAPACTVRIRSTIPLAAGMGSGAAVSVAVMRALSAFLGQPLPLEQVCALAYEVEKIHHGTPSGIDNSVVAYNQAVFFVRGQPLQFLQLPVPFTIVIGDSGLSSPTGEVVSDVRRRWQIDPHAYDELFASAGQVARQARMLIENGTPEEMGPLMNHNHSLLAQMGVSSPELDDLVEAARRAGALGAKLSGGGRGGAMVALVRAQDASQVANALREAGAARVIQTIVAKKPKS